MINHALRLLLILAVVIGSAASNSHAQGDAGSPPPEKMIRDFYSWYLKSMQDGKDPFQDRRSELKRFATARLIQEIDRARKSEDGIGSDPFLDAQDFDKDWAKNITVSNVSIKGDTATADVQLRGREMGTQKLRLNLRQESGAWKVDKVASR